MRDLKWRLVAHGIALVGISLAARAGVCTYTVATAWILGWISFPLVMGWPRDIDGKDGAR